MTTNKSDKKTVKKAKSKTAKIADKKPAPKKKKSNSTIINKPKKKEKKKRIIVVRKGHRLQRRLVITENKTINFNLLLIITFLSGVVLIISTYAWLSVSLNVKIDSLNLSVSSDSGLFISLDGENYSDSVEISLDSVITDLAKIYPSNTNQWASGGLWPVSTTGLPNSNTDKFSFFQGQVSKYKSKVTNRRYLNTTAVTEDNSNSANAYIAFDVFLKNVSGSPISDNLYLDDGTDVTYGNGMTDDDKAAMSGVLNSVRLGFVKVGSIATKSALSSIQGIQCNGNCQMVIYEPNSTAHSAESIKDAYDQYGVTLVDGQYTPSYAVTSEGTHLDYANGQEGSGLALDSEHFAQQKTITTFSNSIFTLPNGITKLRVYIWIEGQDMDSLATSSRGAQVDVTINFVKDLAGYQE